MKKTSVLWLLLFLIGIPAAVAGWYFAKSRHAEQALPVFGAVPAFELTDQDGLAVSDKRALGRVSVFGFIFTNCSMQCPIITGEQLKLQQKFADDRRFFLASVSIDPKTDTPAVLKAYATKIGAKLNSWSFLTGPEAAIENLSRQGFKLAAAESASGESGMIHSQKLVLVDADLQIRGYFDSQDPEAMGALSRAISQLIENTDPLPAETIVSQRY